MGTNQIAVTLTAKDMSETDWEVIEELGEGRVTAQYLSDQLDISRQYASDRLRRFREHGIVKKPAPALFELVPEEVPKRER